MPSFDREQPSGYLMKSPSNNGFKNYQQWKGKLLKHKISSGYIKENNSELQNSIRNSFLHKSLLIEKS
jgi:hypothetical protein